MSSGYFVDVKIALVLEVPTSCNVVLVVIPVMAASVLLLISNLSWILAQVVTCIEAETCSVSL